MKGLRRAIIVICLIILTVRGLNSLANGKYYDENINEMVNGKEYQVIEVGKDMKLDNDTILITRIINTEDKTYIRYSVKAMEKGWSFSESAIKVFDDREHQYEYSGAGSDGKDGFIKFDRINEDANYITVKIDWYDRKNEMKISLMEEGEVNEN